MRARAVIEIKICGLADHVAIEAAADAGARLAGFVYHPASPRHLELSEIEPLAAHAARKGLETVLVVANAPDALFTALPGTAPSVDWIQLHGRETTQDAARIARVTGRRIMRAHAVATRADCDAISTSPPVERLLLDAKPPPGAAREGGHGAAFNWSVTQGWTAPRPWLLAGGLTAQTVARALAVSGAPGVDVSSGVEARPGVKDPQLIEAFIAAALAAASQPKEPTS